MKLPYIHRVIGEQVTVLSVDLIGTADSRDFLLTLSNGERMTMHDLARHFDAMEGIADCEWPYKRQKVGLILPDTRMLGLPRAQS